MCPRIHRFKLGEVQLFSKKIIIIFIFIFITLISPRSPLLCSMLFEILSATMGWHESTKPCLRPSRNRRSPKGGWQCFTFGRTSACPAIHRLWGVWEIDSLATLGRKVRYLIVLVLISRRHLRLAQANRWTSTSCPIHYWHRNRSRTLRRRSGLGVL